MPLTLPVDLEVDEDGLEASLKIPRDVGPELPEAAELASVLQEQEGLESVDVDAVADLLGDACTGRSAGPRVIARGQEPQRGADAHLEWEGEFFESVQLRRPDGSVDHYRRTKTSVAAGQHIATVVPPQPGIDGRTVRGDRIEAEPGQDWRPQLHPTVAWEDSEQTRIRAEVGGRVEFARDRVSISELLEVPGVDHGSSSIDFDAAVEVKGDVLEGFAVRATGSVHVHGFVEVADVHAGGGLRVQGGVIGKKQATISSGGDMELGTARELDLRCGGQLVAHGELLFCDAVVLGDVTATGHRVVGGDWTAGGSLYCEDLGSDTETPTFIRVGVHREMEERQKELATEREELQAEMATRQKQREKFERKRARTDKEQLALDKLGAYVEQLRARDARLVEEEAKLRRRIKETRRAGTVWVQGTVHAGVKIIAGGLPRTLEVSKPLRGPLKIGYESRRQIPVITYDRKNQSGDDRNDQSE